MPAAYELALLAALYSIWRLARVLPLDRSAGAISRGRDLDHLQHTLHFPTELSLQRFVIDHPVFRADLFDQTTYPPGNLRSAHFHPNFEGVEPCDRVWPEEIKQDPTGWLAGELSVSG